MTGLPTPQPCLQRICHGIDNQLIFLNCTAGCGNYHFASCFLLFVCLVCTHYTHIFLLHKSHTDETHTLKQSTNNYCSWSPSYRSVE